MPVQKSEIPRGSPSRHASPIRCIHQVQLHSPAQAQLHPSTNDMETKSSPVKTTNRASGERATLTLNFGLVMICSVAFAALCVSSGLAQLGIDSSQFVYVLLFLLNPVASIIGNTLIYVFVMKRLPIAYFIPSLVCGIIHMVLFVSCGLWLLISKDNFLNLLGRENSNLVGISSTTTTLAAMFQATFLVSAALCFKEIRAAIKMVHEVDVTSLVAGGSSSSAQGSTSSQPEDSSTASGSSQATETM